MWIVVLTIYEASALESRPTCPSMIVGKAISQRQVREDNVAGKGAIACLWRCLTLSAAGASLSDDACYCDSGTYHDSDGDLDFTTCAVMAAENCQDNDAGLAAHYRLSRVTCSLNKQYCAPGQYHNNMLKYCPKTCGSCGVPCSVQYGDEIIIQNQFPGYWLLQYGGVPLFTSGSDDASINNKSAVWKLLDKSRQGVGCVFYGDEIVIQNQYIGYVMLARHIVPVFTRAQEHINNKAAVWKILDKTKQGHGCVVYGDEVVIENQNTVLSGPRMLERNADVAFTDDLVRVTEMSAVWKFLNTSKNMPSCSDVRVERSPFSVYRGWREDSLFDFGSSQDDANTNVVNSFIDDPLAPRVNIAEWTQKSDKNGDGELEYNELALTLLEMDTDRNHMITLHELDEFLARHSTSCGHTMVRRCQDCSGWSNCRGDCEWSTTRGCEEKSTTDDSWLHCADEGVICTCRTQIKFGNYDALFTEPLPAHGDIMCNNAAFHLPNKSADGIVKFCVCQEGAAFVEHRMDAYLESKGLFATNNLHDLLDAMWSLFPHGARKVDVSVRTDLETSLFLQKLKDIPLYLVLGQNIFISGDTDGDTRISRQEIHAMVRASDTNDDERLSLDEFRYFFGGRMKTTEFWTVLLGNSLGINTDVPMEELDMYDAPSTMDLLPIDDVTDALRAMMPSGVRFINLESHAERIISIAHKYAFILENVVDTTKIVIEGDANGDQILEETELESLVEHADENQDGIINRDEFVSLFGQQSHSFAFMEAITQDLLDGSGEWTRFDNYCVSQEGLNVEENNTPKGDGSVESCKHVCDTIAYCVAIEWNDSGWNGAKCKLVEGQELQGVRGADDAQWHDTVCFVRTGVQMLKESLALAYRGFARVRDLVDVLRTVMPLTLREKANEVVLAGSSLDDNVELVLNEHVEFVDMGPGMCLAVDHNEPRFIMVTKVTHEYCKVHCAHSTECEAYSYNTDLRLCHLYTPDLLEADSVRWGDAHCMVKKLLHEGDICRSVSGHVDRQRDCGGGLACIDARNPVGLRTMLRAGKNRRDSNHSTPGPTLMPKPKGLNVVMPQLGFSGDELPMVCGVGEGSNVMEHARAKGKNCGNRSGFPRLCDADSVCLQTTTLAGGNHAMCEANAEQRDCRCIVVMNRRCGRSRGWSFPCEDTADCLMEISDANSEIKMCPKNTLNCKCYGQLISRGVRTIMRYPAWTLHMWINYVVLDPAYYNIWLTKVGFSDSAQVALIQQNNVDFFLYRFYDRFKFDAFRDDSNYLSTLSEPNAAAIMYLAIGISNYERLKEEFTRRRRSPPTSGLTHVQLLGFRPSDVLDALRSRSDHSHTPNEGFVIIYGVDSRRDVTNVFMRHFRTWASVAYDMGIMHLQFSSHFHFVLVRIGGDELTLFTSYPNTMTLRSTGAHYYTTDKFVKEVMTPICESLRLQKPLNATQFSSAFHGAQYSTYAARIRAIVALGVERTRGQVSMDNISMLYNKGSVSQAQMKYTLPKMTPYLNLAGLEQTA